MYKILFIAALKDNNTASYWVNLGYLSSSVKRLADISTRICLFPIEMQDHVISEVREYKPNMVAVSLQQYGYLETLHVIEEIKRIIPQVYIIAGNIEASLFPEYILTTTQIDGIIVGEGEETLYELCKRIINAEGFDNCQGFYYKDSGSVKKNPLRKRITNLDSLPYPDRPKEWKKQSWHSIIGSRGCSGNCSFCSSNTIYQTQSHIGVTFRSVKSIVDEMVYLVHEYGCKYISFLDSTFCIGDPYDRLKQLYEEIKARGLWVQFILNLRCDQITTEVVSLLKEMESIGLSCVEIGVDSANSADLSTYCKPSTIQINEKAISLLSSNGVHFVYGFINFNPYTSIETLSENLSFLKRNKLQVDTDTISRRLMISSGIPIIKRLHSDKLLLQQIDKPILDPFGYKFANPEIDKIYLAAKWCGDNFIKDSYEFRWICYQRYLHITKTNNQSTFHDFLTLSNDFAQKKSDAIFDIFERIIANSNYKFDDIIGMVAELTHLHNEKLSQEYQKLSALVTKLVIYLARTNDHLLINFNR